MRFIHNKKYDTVYKMMIPKREWLFEIKNDTVGNIKKYDSIFNKFEKDYQRDRAK